MVLTREDFREPAYLSYLPQSVSTIQFHTYVSPPLPGTTEGEISLNKDFRSQIFGTAWTVNSELIRACFLETHCFMSLRDGSAKILMENPSWFSLAAVNPWEVCSGMVSLPSKQPYPHSLENIIV